MRTVHRLRAPLATAFLTLALAGPVTVMAAGPASAVVAKDASCSPSGTQLSISAFDQKFNKDCLAAPADTAFTIDFQNLDRGIPHNVAIYEDAESTKPLFKGELVDGPGRTTYSVPALRAGKFFFRCDPHPDMTGTFNVK